MSNTNLIEAGITAYKSGNRQEACSLFIQAIKTDPRNETAWLWLGECVTDLEKKKYCFQKVLEINPGNPSARRELAKLQPPPEKPVARVQPDPVAFTPHKASRKPQSQNKLLKWFLIGGTLVACLFGLFGVGWWYLSGRIAPKLPAFLPGNNDAPSGIIPNNSDPLVPLMLQEITSDNVGKLVEVKKLGKSAIDSIAFESNHDLIAVETSNGIYLYRATDGKEINLIPVDTSFELASISPDGQFLVIDLLDSIEIRRISDGSLQATIPQNMEYSIGCAFSPDGRFLAAGDEAGSIDIWNVNDGSLIKTIPSLGFLSNVVYSPDGQTLAMIATNESIQLWNVSTGTQVSIIPDEYAERIAFSRDGQILVSVAYQGIKLWDINTGTLRASMAEEALYGVRDIALSPDSQVLAVSMVDKGIQLWRISDGTLITSIWTDDIDNISFFSNGQVLVSAAVNGSVKFWQASDGTLINSIDDHLFSEIGLAFSPDGKLLASGSLGGIIRLWDVSAGKLTQVIDTQTATMNHFVFSNDGQYLISASSNGVIAKWQIGALTPLFSIELGNELDFSGLVVAPNGKIVASTDHSNIDSVSLWNVEDGSLIKTLNGCETNRDGLVFSSDSQMVALGTYPMVCVWNISDGSLVHSFENPTGLSGLLFSPDGTLLAVNREEGIDFWKITTGEKMFTFDYADGELSAFSPNGQVFIAADQKDIWNMEYGGYLMTLDDLNDEIDSLTFSRDGRWLALVTEDQIIHLWGVK